jgi:hypothetical protein
LQVELVVPLDVMGEKFDEESMSGEFDQGAWKKFWIKHQRYVTTCLECINARKEGERREAMAGAEPELLEDPGDDYPEWGPVFLSAASRAIIMRWYREGQERVFGKDGRKRRQIVVSDDEGEEMHAEWAKAPVLLSEASKAISILWLRTARSRIMTRSGKGGEQLRGRRTRPGKKNKSGQKSNSRRK